MEDQDKIAGWPDFFIGELGKVSYFSLTYFILKIKLCISILKGFFFLFFFTIMNFQHGPCSKLCKSHISIK